MNRWYRVGSILLALALLAACGGDEADQDEAAMDAADAATSEDEDGGPDRPDPDELDGEGSSSSEGEAEGTAGVREPGTVGTTLLDPVPVGEEAPFGEGLVIEVTDIGTRDLEALGPGEIAGPGIVVSVEARNDAGDPIDLAGFVLSAYFGEERSPAVEATGAYAEGALTGTLEPGETARGEYAFFVPAGESPIVIEAHHTGSESIVVIEH